MLQDIVRGAYDRMSIGSVKDSREVSVLRKISSIIFLNITSRMFYEVVFPEITVDYHWKDKWKRFIDHNFEELRPNIEMFYYCVIIVL